MGEAKEGRGDSRDTNGEGSQKDSLGVVEDLGANMAKTAYKREESGERGTWVGQREKVGEGEGREC